MVFQICDFHFEKSECKTRNDVRVSNIAGFPRSARDKPRLPRRPTHLASTQQVQMQVKHALTGIGTNVVNRAETVLQSAFTRNFRRHQLAVADDPGISFTRLVQTSYVFLWND
jgi:hypothetical protein